MSAQANPKRTLRILSLLLATVLLTVGLSGAAWAQAKELQAADCKVRSAHSSAQPLRVVELYTSEGCSSCPPADRWLSQLKGRPDVLALAFHVTYWDRLGWPDRFASPEFTERQYAIAQRAGSRQVYTPQVLVDGKDWRGWPALPQSQKSPSTASPSPDPPPSLRLQRDGDQVTATVEAWNGPGQLSGYFAVLEDNHQSHVRAGENAGENLRHDHVVRSLKPVPAWNATQGTQVKLGVTAGTAEHPRRVAFVVQEAGSQRPLQALALGCTAPN